MNEISGREPGIALIVRHIFFRAEDGEVEGAPRIRCREASSLESQSHPRW